MMRLNIALLTAAAALSVCAWASVQWHDGWRLTAVAAAGALLLIAILFHRLERTAL